MLRFLTRDFSHWKSSTSRYRKLRFNPKLNLKKPEELPPRHDFINFKEFTGNEILYTLKNAQYLRPTELACALLELGLRPGKPSSVDWNTHETVQSSVKHIKRTAAQFAPKVLTSLAHAAQRLELKDNELWTKLETHILRTLPGIEPKGLSYSFNAFTVHGSAELYCRLIEVAPLHIIYLNGRDLLNIVRGCTVRQIEAESFFSKWVYPLLFKYKKMCSPQQLEELKALLVQRTDCPPELLLAVDEAISYKWERRSVLSFGGLSNNSS